MEKGYIKLSRKFFENKIWQAARAFNEGEAWLDLIQLARFETSEITSRIGVHEITWGRGQYPASNRFLMRKWGRSEQWVKTFLSKLKKEKMITVDASQGINVITLLNYDAYNSIGDTQNSPNNSPSNSLNNMTDIELQEFITQQVARQVTQMSLTSHSNKKKDKEYNNKKELSNDSSKKATDVATRKDAFLSMLKSFSSRYPESMLTDFFNYWTELNPSGNKMRFEMQRTWETSKRLATWAKNDWNFSKTKQELPQMPSIFDTKPQNGDRNDKGQVWSEEKNRWLN